MTPGELDQVISIQREALTSDGMGGQVVDLFDIATNIWAKVRPLSGREVEMAGAMNPIAMATFIIRYDGHIEHSDRITWDGKVYNIRYIEPASSRSLYTMIHAEWGVAQ